MKRFILLLLIAAAVLLAFLMPYVTFEKERPVLEKGETYKAADLIAKAGGEVTSEQEYLKTDEVGRFEFTYTVKRLFFSKDVVLFYEVVDTTPPDLKIKEKVLHIKADLPYGRKEVLQNVSFNEGDIEFATDLDVCYPGNYQVDVIAKDEYGNASKGSYELIVDDEEPPFIFAYGDGTVIKRGSQVNIYDHIGYGDNADRDPILEIDGKVNTARAGEYPLHAVLRDASGNETKWDLTVSVVNRISYDDDEEEEPIAFADFVNEYKEKGLRFGIDVSEWQGDIDFVKLKEAGCEFVMLRIGFSRNGTLYLDKSFKDNLAKAKSVGMPLGVYYYSNDKSAEEVRSVFRQIVSELGDTRLELPVVFDWENFMDFQYYEISLKDLDHMYQVFEEEAEKMGYTPMLYGSKYYLENLWRKTDKRTIWLAHYTDWSSYEGRYKLWQTCAWGQVDGIEENVDFDILFTD